MEILISQSSLRITGDFLFFESQDLQDFQDLLLNQAELGINSTNLHFKLNAKFKFITCSTLQVFKLIRNILH
jgi:hypothetical protein